MNRNNEGEDNDGGVRGESVLHVSKGRGRNYISVVGLLLSP
jgi:hypothetical protein